MCACVLNFNNKGSLFLLYVLVQFALLMILVFRRIFWCATLVKSLWVNCIFVHMLYFVAGVLWGQSIVNSVALSCCRPHFVRHLQWVLVLILNPRLSVLLLSRLTFAYTDHTAHVSCVPAWRKSAFFSGYCLQSFWYQLLEFSGWGN